jgi:GDPmannose 4,6-dehydratase
VGDFVAAAFARVDMVNWQHLVTTDPVFVRPVDAVQLVGDPGLAKGLL